MTRDPSDIAARVYAALPSDLQRALDANPGLLDELVAEAIREAEAEEDVPALMQRVPSKWSGSHYHKVGWAVSQWLKKRGIEIGPRRLSDLGPWPDIRSNDDVRDRLEQWARHAAKEVLDRLRVRDMDYHVWSSERLVPTKEEDSLKEYVTPSRRGSKAYWIELRYAARWHLDKLRRRAKRVLDDWKRRFEEAKKRATEKLEQIEKERANLDLWYRAAAAFGPPSKETSNMVDEANAVLDEDARKLRHALEQKPPTVDEIVRKWLDQYAPANTPRFADFQAAVQALGLMDLERADTSRLPAGFIELRVEPVTPKKLTKPAHWDKIPTARIPGLQGRWVLHGHAIYRDDTPRLPKDYEPFSGEKKDRAAADLARMNIRPGDTELTPLFTAPNPREIGMTVIAFMRDDGEYAVADLKYVAPVLLRKEPIRWMQQGDVVGMITAMAAGEVVAVLMPLGYGAREMKQLLEDPDIERQPL